MNLTLSELVYSWAFYFKENQGRRDMMNEEARRLRNEYMREYRKKNPEKVKRIQERYWENRAVKELSKIQSKEG
jgi:Tfp pilus assembly protein PilO